LDEHNGNEIQMVLHVKEFIIQNWPRLAPKQKGEKPFQPWEIHHLSNPKM
jgi:hypothetical protein